MTKTSAHLRVDWPQGDARGLCAAVLPDFTDFTWTLVV